MRIRNVVWWNRLIGQLLALICVFGLASAQAASIDGDHLGTLSMDGNTDNNLYLSTDTTIFTQALDPSASGFISNNGSGQWRYSPSDGATIDDVEGYYIRFDGAPALLGIPSETGTLTVGAGNVIEDVWTDRIYARPVVFVSFEDPNLTPGVSIVPTAPITSGNQFLFDIRMADGFAADLEGATLKYFIAEEGWHRLADGRMLLISSAELRDTGFTGQTIELGASFTDAVTVAQLQRPMLFDNGTLFRQLPDMEVYQGATVTAGTGDFDSISLRMMQSRSVEEANNSTVYAGRVGFMVLGSLTSLDKKLHWVKDTNTNIRGGSHLTVPAANFTNYPHSAATSPLLNKAACAEDDDVQNFCVYMSMPTDMFSRGKFNTPRFPYMDANFEPLQMQRTFYSEHENWDWTDILSNDLISPTVDSDNQPVTGTLAQLHLNFVADRGWDDYIVGTDHWHWFATYHYNTCIFDSMNTACVDYELGNTIVDAHELHWSTSMTYDNSNELNGTRGAVWGTPPDLSIEQKLFSVQDYLRRNHAIMNEYVSAPAWAANQAAAYLNYDLPTESVIPSRLQPDRTYKNYDTNFWMTIHEETSSAWQLHAMTLTAAATEWNCGTCGVTDFGEWRSGSSWNFSIPYPSSMSARTREEALEKFGYRIHIKPVVDKITRSFRVGDYLFANVPWGIDATDFRWVRSASKDITTATTIATNTLGYQATASDADQFITFCMTYYGSERCGEWFEAGDVPYATNVHITPEFSEPVAGSGLLGQHTYVAPDDDAYSLESASQYRWQTLENSYWTDISGATENTIDTYIAAGTQVRFCVTPRSVKGLMGPEACSPAIVMQGDFDGDGYSDDWDSDDDNDGVLDWFDAFPFDNTESVDTDGDGIGNNADSDDDNDGISDEDENAGLTDPLKYDTDGDGTNDLNDPQPTSYGNFPDFDNDGLDDTVDEDRDNDGVIDFYYQVEGKSGLQTLIEEGDVVLNWMRFDDDPYSACVANAITVTSNADSGPGTLRQALADLCASDPGGELNTITFSGAMTIALESPLLITKGVKIDGNREVVIDGQNAITLFEVIMTDKLSSNQFPHLVGLTLRNGYSELSDNALVSEVINQGSAIQMTSASYVMLDFTLVENMTAPAINGENYKLYANNSLLANISGGVAALYTVDGQLNLSSSTLYNSEGGSLTVTGDGSAQLYNSLLLNGPTGSTECLVSNWSQQYHSWVEGSECGITSTGSVTLADPENGDYRPVPGSANIEAGPSDIDPDSVDFDLLGNARIMGEYNPDNPVEEGGPIYPYIDIGAIEYDFYGDFDGDGTNDTEDAFPNDATETTDSDGDGVGDNSDALPNDANETLDTDRDGMGNNADTDDDNDQYNDDLEIEEGSDPLNANSIPLDTDGDLLPNSMDSDDDNDGVIDASDAFPLDATESVDSDNDGTGNNADNDDDSDGVNDEADAFPLDDTEWADTDGDGTGNNADPDDDNDGVDDGADAFPLDASESVDTDGDGTGNNADPDDDNDGYSDAIETSEGSDLLSDVSKPLDTDGDFLPNSTDVDDDNDGVNDGADAFPLDASESVDTDSDGTGNNADLDDDNDGVDDGADAFPMDASESVDTDGDGTGNNADPDDDNDGYSDAIESSESSDPLSDVSKPLDSDGDFLPNSTDVDDDNDGVADLEDAFPLDASESVDTDGDGTGNNADNDDDSDGVNDDTDAFPQDDTEWADTDGDGTGDNADTDDDNNGIMDAADQISMADPTAGNATNKHIDANNGEQVVLSFALTSTDAGNEVRSFTLAAGGELDPVGNIKSVRLYRDDNEDGIADAGELISEGSFELAGGQLTLTLSEAWPLPMGDTHFLVTYEF